jgi:hypothetical protein
MEWISVKDRLPSFGDWVLVWNNDPEIDAEVPYLSYLHWKGDKKMWYHDQCDCLDLRYFTMDKIDYWMPLTEKPK